MVDVGEDVKSGRDRRRFITAAIGGLVATVAAAIRAVEVPKVKAEGEVVVVGGVYTTALSRTMIQGNVGTLDAVIEGRHTATSGEAWGIFGRSDASLGRGVYGYSGHTSGDAEGVYGRAYSPNGQGVQGDNYATTGIAHGVRGWSASTSARAVEGEAVANSGETYGVWGESNSTSGIGVRGLATALDGWAEGVCGRSNSFSGTGVHGYATSTTGPAWGVWGRSDSTSGIGIMGQAGSAGATPIVAQGTTGQSADLQQWQNSAGAALARISKDGRLGIGTAPSFALHIVSGTTGPLTAASAPGAGPRPNSFICENLTPGNFKSQFTFRASAANKWSFGNDMNGNGGQNFFIWDEVAAATRLFIDSAGKVGLGTMSPTEKLHVVGNVKAASFITGDVVFANGYRLTEDEQSGLLFLNQKGERIARLDEQGNLRIKGKVLEET